MKKMDKNQMQNIKGGAGNPISSIIDSSGKLISGIMDSSNKIMDTKWTHDENIQKIQNDESHMGTMVDAQNEAIKGSLENEGGKMTWDNSSEIIARYHLMETIIEAQTPHLDVLNIL